MMMVVMVRPAPLKSARPYWYVHAIKMPPCPHPCRPMAICPPPKPAQNAAQRKSRVNSPRPFPLPFLLPRFSSKQHPVSILKLYPNVPAISQCRPKTLFPYQTRKVRVMHLHGFHASSPLPISPASSLSASTFPALNIAALMTSISLPMVSVFARTLR